MNYLYGDSTPSSLKSNFLEFLRDAIDFCVFALLADDRIRRGREDVEALRREADAETERLRAFVATVMQSIERAPKGRPDAPTAQCAAHLTTQCEESLAAFTEAVRKQLAANVAEAEAKESAERAACGKALETLLAPHDPPDATSITQIVLDDSGAYAANGVGETKMGLAWRFELAVSAGHAWSAPVRVERVVPQLEIRAPQLSGWISKEVKIKPLRLERYVVTELVDDGETMNVKLRSEIGARGGFDLEIDTASRRVASIERVAEDTKDDGSAGAFEVEADDASKLVDLAEKLRASLAGLERRRLSAATLDGGAFESLPSFTEVVTRMVTMMAPITREISDRSLTPTELVLRRLLGNDRREEIFVTKASLREKYSSLPGMLRACFTPLSLDVARPQKPEPPPHTPMPIVRSELPPSRPPPPQPTAARPPEPTIPKAAPPPTISVEEPVSISGAFPAGGSPKTRDEIVATLKKHVAAIKAGNADEGYKGFTGFFSDDAFASLRPEDQRQSLKVMVLGKTPTPANDAVVDAHLAAITCLQRLAETSNDPLDFEMLGVCHQVIEDVETASKMYEKALEIERARNPQSELCGRVMKRISAM